MTVIGSINIDNYLTVNQLPSSGMTSTASTLALYPGGKAVNMAIGVSRLGAEASVLGAIGTVSYTHLDVYKRQLWNTPPTPQPSRRPSPT